VSAAERISRQKRFDECIRWEVLTHIRDDCGGVEIPITTIGVGAGAYHAVNTTLKHPQLVRQRCACSGIYDIAPFMDGFHNDEVYFNNPVEYLPNLEDPEVLAALRGCAIRLTTGTGTGEDWRDTYRPGHLLEKGLERPIDDQGPQYRRDWDCGRSVLVRCLERQWRAEP
jgi:esterase/lipase superfamily enzyme